MKTINKRALLKILVFSLISFTLLFFFSCKKEKVETRIETGTVTDVDGNIYNTVKIGNQWWMAENLNVQHYRNGDSISYRGDAYERTLDSAKWVNSDMGAYCKGRIDYLYNGYTVLDQRNIAPDGWHIPTDDEWKQLEILIGLSKNDVDQVNWRGNNEANKLRLHSTKYWANSPNQYDIWGANDSGFNALPNGCLMFYGKYSSSLDEMGFWWSSTLADNQLWYRYLDKNKGGVFRYVGPMTYGFSIRCVKD
jgi:uncharacterized protein (TIGR02145 family)